MYNFKQIKRLHLEISNNCQAACPFCPRNVDSGLENPLLQLSEWTIDDFKHIVNPEVLNQIIELNFLGNAGDALMNNDLIEMCQYVKDINSNIRIKIHTNGGIRNTEYWVNLQKALPDNHLIIFGIDGLEDTNHIHRVNVQYDKVINNATSFINAGGKAQWSFLTFKHNEHQIETARELSIKYGFIDFQEKQSTRFTEGEDKLVLDKNGKVTHTISPPTNNKVKFFSKEAVKLFDTIINNSKDIHCFAQKNSEAYIDAHKNIYPCCFVGTNPLIYSTPEDVQYNADIRMLNEINEVMGKLKTFNVMESSLKDILDSVEWNTIFIDAWKEKKLAKCVLTCGLTEHFPVRSSEFIKKENV